MSYIKQPDSGGGGGTIGGSIANEQVAFGSGTNTIEGTNDLKYVKGDAALKLAADDSGLLVGAGGSNFDSDFYFQVYGSEARVDSGLPVRIKGSLSDTKFITETSVAATGGQEIGQIQFKGLDSGSSVQKFGQIQLDVENNSATAKQGSMLFKIADGSTNTFHEVVRITESGLTLGGNAPATQYTLPTVDGNANEVLQTNGSGTLSFAAISGGGGMTPPGFPTGNTDVYDEVMGLSNGLMGSYTSGGPTSSQWANGFMRFRPHYFSRTAAIDKVMFNMTAAPTVVNNQTISFALYESDSNNQPGALKAKSEATYNSASSTGIQTQTWTAEAGKDLNVTAGEMYFCAFHSNFASGTGSSATLSFWNSGNMLGGMAVDFDTSPQTIMTYYPSSTGFAPASLTLGGVAGDTSGFTWPMWMVDYA